MVEPKNGSTILKPQNVKAVTTKFDIAKPQKRDSDNHINGKALTINFDRHPIISYYLSCLFFTLLNFTESLL